MAFVTVLELGKTSQEKEDTSVVDANLLFPTTANSIITCVKNAARSWVEGKLEYIGREKTTPTDT